MAWYTTASYPALDSTNRSLIIACANMLKKLELEYNPLDLQLALGGEAGRSISWNDLSQGVRGLALDSAGGGTWPLVDTAIMRFQRPDETGQLVDHYCAVADPQAQSIIDSLDGVIKPANTYGEALGWASFTRSAEPLVEEETDDEWPSITSKKGLDPARTYIWVKDDNIWEVAPRLGFSPLELLEHNGIDDWRTIRLGDVLHLPEAREIAKTEVVARVEVLPEPQKMHVAKSGGARKWSFGRIVNAEDFAQTGPLQPEGKNVEILASAHLSLAEGEDREFYIDCLAFGDYPTTGRLTYTIGFDPADLADGHVEKVAQPLPKALAATSARIAEQLETINQPAPEVSPLLRPHPAPVVMDVRPMPTTSAVKATLHPLYDDRQPRRFLFTEELWVSELDQRRRPKHVNKWDNVDAALGVYKGEDEYGDPIEYVLPLSHEETGLWFMIPRQKLVLEDEIFNPTLNANELPQPTHKLTASERTYWIPVAKALAQYTRFKALFSNKKG